MVGAGGAACAGGAGAWGGSPGELPPEHPKIAMNKTPMRTVHTDARDPPR